ncbi:MAG: hypothetical protein ACE5JG_08960, partial [Planctomycetota bacterium]
EAKPAPLLSISANGGAGTEQVRGWPLILQVTVSCPQAPEGDGPRALRLKVVEGTWADLLDLEVRDGGGKAQEWPLRLAPIAKPGVELTLDRETSGALVWLLSPEDSERLAAGTYRLQAVLRDERSGGDEGRWRGSVRSDRATVRIVPPPDPLPPEAEGRRDGLLARYHVLRGEDEAAMAVAQRMRERAPDSIAAATLQGDLLAAAGRDREALKAYNRALALFRRQHPDAGEPPRDLLRRQSRLLDRVLEAAPTR